MTNITRITTTAAVILSLAAAGAQTASARSADFAPMGKQAPAALHNRPDRTMIPASGGALGRAALLRLLAQQERHRVVALSAYREGQLAASFDVGATAAKDEGAPHAVVRVHVPPRGFDWGDGALGAAGSLLLATLALGGGLAISRRRPRPSRRRTALQGSK